MWVRHITFHTNTTKWVPPPGRGKICSGGGLGTGMGSSPPCIGNQERAFSGTPHSIDKQNTAVSAGHPCVDNPSSSSVLRRAHATTSGTLTRTTTAATWQKECF